MFKGWPTTSEIGGLGIPIFSEICGREYSRESYTTFILENNSAGHEI